MNSSLISVIVPVYNVEKYLRRCVDSILTQSYQNLEIILIDDGSTDFSGRICDEYAQKDKRIVVVHKQNGGLSSARNEGLQIATGEYVGFIDSDDCVNPDMYFSMISTLKEFSADICMCGCYIKNDNGSILSVDQFRDHTIYSISEIIYSIILPLKTASWNKLFRRNILRNSIFPVGKIHGEDLVFLLSVLSDNTLLCSTEYIGYNYIKRENSITTTAFKESSFDEVWCKDMSLRLLSSKFPQYSKLLRRHSFRARLNLIRKMSKTNNTSLPEYKEYLDWLKNNFRNSTLELKDCIEYSLLVHFPLLYKKVFLR